MGKRKREIVDGLAPAGAIKSRKEESSSTPKQTSRQTHPTTKSKDKEVGFESVTAVNGKTSLESAVIAENSDLTTVQIIAGSYERVLHGFTASIPSKLITSPSTENLTSQTNTTGDASTEKDGDTEVQFSDTFLFNAHSSAIRCLAISPPSDSTDQKPQKIMLASGSTDERINLYNLSTAPPARGSKSKPKLPTLSNTSIAENPKNREVGALLHHSSSITALYFPTRSKLLSAAEDNTIAISRTRDWTVLSTIKAPIPKPVGRPSGDTAGPGEVPAGVNAFAVHPSMKLMVSVGKGERCMRLWNLVTGKKAGVLNFSREMLQQVGEGRFGLGEGRKVEWDTEGEEFVVGFERGAVVFGMDSKPRARISPTPLTKLHQIRYLPASINPHVVALSTEDGRILFYDTKSLHTSTNGSDGSKSEDIPACTLLAQMGGPASGMSNRVKDFEILTPQTNDGSSTRDFIIITGSSNGAVRVWALSISDLQTRSEVESSKTNGSSEEASARGGFTAKQIGRLIGTYQTSTRITCLKAFVMSGSPEETGDEHEGSVLGSEEESSDDSSEVEDE